MVGKFKDRIKRCGERGIILSWLDGIKKKKRKEKQG